jgi:5'-nucleotidase
MVPKNTKAGKYTVAVSQADGDEATASIAVNKAGGVGGIIGAIVDWLWDLLGRWF